MSDVTRTFTVDELEDLAVRAGGRDVVEDEIVGKGRWHLVHRAVFRHNDQLWAVEYLTPATEMQEVDTWNYQNPVTATLVEPYQVTVTKYRPVTR